MIVIFYYTQNRAATDQRPPCRRRNHEVSFI